MNSFSKLSNWMLPLFSVSINCIKTATYIITSLQPSMQSSHCTSYCCTSVSITYHNDSTHFSYSIYCSLCSAGANATQLLDSVTFCLIHHWIDFGASFVKLHKRINDKVDDDSDSLYSPAWCFMIISSRIRVRDERKSCSIKFPLG